MARAPNQVRPEPQYDPQELEEQIIEEKPNDINTADLFDKVQDQIVADNLDPELNVEVEAKDEIQDQGKDDTEVIGHLKRGISQQSDETRGGVLDAEPVNAIPQHEDLTKKPKHVDVGIEEDDVVDHRKNDRVQPVQDKQTEQISEKQPDANVLEQNFRLRQAALRNRLNSIEKRPQQAEAKRSPQNERPEPAPETADLKIVYEEDNENNEGLRESKVKEIDEPEEHNAYNVENANENNVEDLNQETIDVIEQNPKHDELDEKAPQAHVKNSANRIKLEQAELDGFDWSR